MSSKKLRKPDLSYLLALRSELESAYAEQDSQIDRMRKLRTLQQPVNLDPNLSIVNVEVRDPTATDEIARVVATFTVNPPKLTVKPSKEGEAAEANATLREHWTEEVLRVAGNRQSGMSTLHALVDACVGDGGAWCKVLFDKDVWEERYSLRRSSFEDDEPEKVLDAEGNQVYDKDGKPKVRRGKLKDEKFNEATEEAKRNAGPPFAWVACDARGVYPVWHNGKLDEVLEVQERPLHSTLRRYRIRVDDEGNFHSDSESGLFSEEMTEPVSASNPAEDSRAKVYRLEYHDRDWIAVAIVGHNKKGNPTGVLVDCWKHGYGETGYFYAPGIYTNWWKNRKIGWSVSQSKAWLIEYRAFLWTLHAQVAARDTLTPIVEEVPANPSPVIGSNSAPKESTHRIERWQLGQIIRTVPGGKMAPLQFPRIAEALRDEIAMVNEAIAKLEAPHFAGQVGGLEGAGFAISQVLSEARIRYDPLAQNIERMLEEVTRFIWKLVRTKVREDVWVYSDESSQWLKAGPKDLSNAVTLHWQLDPERPSDKLVLARFWHERVAAGTAHLDQAIEAMGDNPDEVRRGRSRDRIRNSPWYTNLLDKMVAEQAGRGDLLQLAQQAEAVAQSGILPGMPPPPNLGIPGPEAAMGNRQVPDMGMLAMAPGGQGVNPMEVPTNSPNMGAMGMAPVPGQSAIAGLQDLGA